MTALYWFPDPYVLEEIFNEHSQNTGSKYNKTKLIRLLPLYLTVLAIPCHNR